MRLIYFAPVPYQSYWQRPHYMVRSLLENVYEEIYWINPTITRLPRWSDLNLTSRSNEKQAAEPLLPGLTVLQPGGLPIEPLPILNLLNDWVFWHKTKSTITSLDIDHHWDIGVGRPSRLACWAMRALPARARFMDMMDDFPAFYSGLSRISMQNTANDLMNRCDYFFFSEQSLIKKLNDYQFKRNIQLIPNGYDMRRLPSLSSSKPEQKIIGFVGTISTWFDWNLVIEIALALPYVKIILIGPRSGEIPSGLPLNIELLPACTVEDAIQHCQKFTVGLIPFLNSQLTESVDPIKYYELRALGIPIWTTSFGSMTDRLEEAEVTQIFSGINWSELWNETTNAIIDEEKISLFRKENDWNVRFEHMAEWLELKHRNIQID